MSEIRVRTRGMGPTHSKGQRVSATATVNGSDYRVVVPWDYYYNAEDMHRVAAERLVLGGQVMLHRLVTVMRETDLDRSRANGYVFTFTVGE